MKRYTVPGVTLIVACFGDEEDGVLLNNCRCPFGNCRKISYKTERLDPGRVRETERGETEPIETTVIKEKHYSNKAIVGF